MAKRQTKQWFSSKIFNSKIHSESTTMSEKTFGYFTGPCLVYMGYYALAGSYLTQFYTDVLGMAGILLTLMPIFSKIVDAITNIIMGRIIDKTHTKQGKARPWILISGVMLAIAGVLLYSVPNADYKVQIAWIIVSYNLYFALAFTTYNMAHTLMVPLSTRDTKQRDGLAMLTSMGTTMLPGLLTTIILPILIKTFGVGNGAQITWMKMMSIISILAIPATLLEYYFTKERITESNTDESGNNTLDIVPFKDQVRACFTDKYWLLIMGFWLVYNISNYLSTGTILYFCNWVLGDSVASGTTYQVLVNAIGQAPLGLGIFVLWPLINKFGKRKVTIVGFLIGALGSLLVLMNTGNYIIVLVGLVIKSFGALPTYAMAAQLAESLDHIEWKYGYRADGFSASISSIIITVTSGISQSILLFGINRFGYIAPSSTEQIIVQSETMKAFFSWGFVGFMMIGYVIGAILMVFFDIEKHMDTITADLEKKHNESKLKQ